MATSENAVLQALAGDDPVAEPAPPRILSVEEILSCNDLEEEVVAVPQWGGAVKVRSFTKGEQHRIRQAATDQQTGVLDQYKLELLMFVQGVVEPKFADVQFHNLRKKNAGAVDLVLKRLLKLSGLDEAAAKSLRQPVSD